MQQVIYIFEVPLTYMPGNLTRIRVKAVGSIMFSSGNLEGVPWKGSRPIKMPEIIVTPTHKLQGLYLYTFLYASFCTLKMLFIWILQIPSYSLQLTMTHVLKIEVCRFNFVYNSL